MFVPCDIRAAGVIEQCQGGTDTGAQWCCCDPFFWVPSHSMENILTVEHADLQKVVQKSANECFIFIEFSVTVAGCVKSKVIVNFQIIQHETSWSGYCQFVCISGFSGVSEQIEEILIIIRFVRTRQFMIFIFRFWFRVTFISNNIINLANINCFVLALALFPS